MRLEVRRDVGTGRISLVVIILRNRFIKVNFDHNQLTIQHVPMDKKWIGFWSLPTTPCFEPFFVV